MIILTALGLASADAQPIDQLPNIVFILVDDMGYSDIGCYGGEIATPNLDRLAEGGIRFTQMHNTAKCFPSRACLLTGVYAQQCGMLEGYEGIRNAVTLGDVLRTAGYRTLATGKHHSMESLFDKGFDRWFGLRDGATNHFNPGHPRAGEPVPAQKKPGQRFWCIDGETFQPYTPPEKDFYSTDYYTKYALGYLEEYKGEEKPFFLYLSYTAPHDPLQAWPEDIARYKGKYSEGYAPIRAARYRKMVELGIADPAMQLPDATFKDWESLSDSERKSEEQRMEVYAAMIDCVDQNIGKLLAKLEELGELENTLILFASDNGSSAEFPEVDIGGTGPIGSIAYWASLGESWANVSNTPFRFYKNDSYEGGICTPFIAYWPARIKDHGSIDHRPLHFIDVMPTLVEIAYADYPKEFRGQEIVPMQGESFYHALLGEDASARKSPLFWKWSRGKAVRKGIWKAVAKGPEWALYNMETDRNETTDLKEQHPELYRELRALYDEWERTTGAATHAIATP